ncbi:hypothetical protein TNCV_1624561 [Trichonephila clavipes]|nr:hypothetical protein TNCV_1624561 [Trichonephila clavipes]
MTDAHRHDIVQEGPTQQLNTSEEYYPKDDDHRHFSNFHLSRKLNNRETQRHRSLVYSSSKNKYVSSYVFHADYLGIYKLKWYMKDAVTGR